MATNDSKITTTICAVGTLRDEGAAEVLMMIACYVTAAACYCITSLEELRRNAMAMS